MGREHKSPRDGRTSLSLKEWRTFTVKMQDTDKFIVKMQDTAKFHNFIKTVEKNVRECGLYGFIISAPAFQQLRVCVPGP